VFPTEPDEVARELLHRNCVCHPGVMARTDALRSAGGYRRIAQHAEDYDLWLRVAEAGRIANLPDVLLSYRAHPHGTSVRNILAQELAALAARGAARLRRNGKPDPLAVADVSSPLDYRQTQWMLRDSVPRPEFALSFFRGVLGRETERGSISTWSRLYLRHGLRDLDGHGGGRMVLLLGHNMLRRRRAGAAALALIPYVGGALVTAIRHPVATCRIAAKARYWLSLARAEQLHVTPS